jgi:hypothetical protein
MGANSVLYFIDMEMCNFTLHGFIHKGASSSGLRSWQDRMKGDDTEDRLLLVSSSMEEITAGVVFSHEQGEVHRDLHPLTGSPRHFSTH